MHNEDEGMNLDCGRRSLHVKESQISVNYELRIKIRIKIMNYEFCIMNYTLDGGVQ